MKWLIRILLVLVAVLVLCAGTLLALGMRADSDRLQMSIKINRPADAVWPYVYEPDKLKQWVTWLKDVERAPGEPVVGAKQVWTMEDANNGGALMKIQSTVLEVDPHRHLKVDLSVPGSIRGTAQYKLTDLGNGTTLLESDSRYTFENSFARFMMPLIMMSAGKKMQSDGERLRAAVEK
jgi:uncharacterized protein YndB with AHSA1/START domain